MKTTLMSLSALAGVAMAQTVTKSSPFNLVTVSDNKTIDGLKLTACHSGAAIESLCTYQSSTPSQFYINTTTYSGSTSPVPVGGQPGVLIWDLPNGDSVSPEALQLYYNVASNVALPLFYPGNYTQTPVAFDQDDLLNMQSYVDDTTSPPNGTGPSRPYYRWYICQTYYGSYTYDTLSWVLGDGKPQNPSCVKTDVKRVFV